MAAVTGLAQCAQGVNAQARETWQASRGSDFGGTRDAHLKDGLPPRRPFSLSQAKLLSAAVRRSDCKVGTSNPLIGPRKMKPLEHIHANRSDTR